MVHKDDYIFHAARLASEFSAMVLEKAQKNEPVEDVLATPEFRKFRRCIMDIDPTSPIAPG